LAKLDNPSDTPSIKPSHAAAPPIVAKNAGITVVAISCDQSLKSDASPIPSTVRFSQPVVWRTPARDAVSVMAFTSSA
jgi:hypothetical protein